MENVLKNKTAIGENGLFLSKDRILRGQQLQHNTNSMSENIIHFIFDLY